ncbi:hypothetical protein BST_2153 [Bacillus stercoris]
MNFFNSMKELGNASTTGGRFSFIRLRNLEIKAYIYLRCYTCISLIDRCKMIFKNHFTSITFIQRSLIIITKDVFIRLFMLRHD